MGWAAIRTAIEKRLQDHGTATPIYYDNESPDVDDRSSWIRVSLITAATRRETITTSASTGHRNYGVVLIQIFTAAGSNAGESAALLDSVIAVFREQVLTLADGSRITFEGDESLGGGEDPAWYNTSWSFPFEHDENLS